MEITCGWLTLNRACNLRCEWCYAASSDFDTSQTMPWPMAKNLIHSAFGMGVTSFVLIGGEPTLHPQMVDMVALIAQLGGRVTVMTNGIALRDIEYCRAIKQAGGENVRANTSLKGITGEEYRRYCGADAFADVLQGVENCHAVGLGNSFVYVLSAENVDGLTDFAETYARLGLQQDPMNFAYCNDCLLGQDFVPTYGKKNIIEIDHSFAEQYEEVYRLMEGNFILHQSLPMCMAEPSMFATMRQRGQAFTACHVVKRNGVIFDTDGSLLLCNHLLGYSIGEYGRDYHDAATLRAFLHGPQMENVRNKLGSMPSTQCAQCGNASLCGGGCCIRWFSEDFEGLRAKYNAARHPV
ncbi:radical SAM protein [Ruminococcaceae bacterium OttesenSCG-928-O06]|nr:radical SAM protein [Ruminococcaceae bacterium OttesenSCG-928-O06]